MERNHRNFITRACHAVLVAVQAALVTDGVWADSHEVTKRLPVSPLVKTDKFPSSRAVLQRKEPDNRFPADYDGASAPKPNRPQRRTAEATRPIP